MEFPKCKAQADFEDLAQALIEVLASFNNEQQIQVFEYAQSILLENNAQARKTRK